MMIASFWCSSFWDFARIHSTWLDSRTVARKSSTAGLYVRAGGAWHSNL